MITKNILTAAIATLLVSVPSETNAEQKNDLAHESEAVRRDPSDIIKVEGKYYVYYTKLEKSAELALAKKQGYASLYPSGYNADIYGAVSLDAGKTWKELGPMILRGKKDRWDCHSVFTPNILAHGGKYYLYYTAVGAGFTNKEYTDANRTAIGLAVGDKPEGPFVKLDQPILKSTKDPEKFDSYRIDDAALRVVDGKIWLYYKGRQWKNTPGNTKMGLAIAGKPSGPFIRANKGAPLQKSGHEVMVWEHGDYVYSFVSHGNGPNRGTVRRTKDGLTFDAPEAIAGKSPRLLAPGLYRPELTGEKASGSTCWGVHMKYTSGYISLSRFELDMKTWSQ